MSIPNTFRPLAGRKMNKNFPMVRLTSNTTGRTVDGGPLPTGFNVTCSSQPEKAYLAFDGNTESGIRVFWENSYYIIDFGRRVELKKIGIYVDSWGDNKKFHLQYERNGSWTDTGIELISNSNPAWTYATLGGIVARRWRLYRGPTDVNTAEIYEINYEAVY